MAKVHRAYRYTWWKDKVARFAEPPTCRHAEMSADPTMTLGDVKRALARIDELRKQGAIPPLVRYVKMDRVRRDTHGTLYVASDEQLAAHLRTQEGCSIDCYGNLVQDGQIVKQHWLQSFTKGDW